MAPASRPRWRSSGAVREVTRIAGVSRKRGSERMRSTKVKPSMPGISTSHQEQGEALALRELETFFAGAGDIDLVARRFEDALFQHPRGQRIVDDQHRRLFGSNVVSMACADQAAQPDLRDREPSADCLSASSAAPATIGLTARPLGQRPHDHARRAEQALDPDRREAIRRRRR